MIPTRISHYPRRDGPLPEGAKYVGRPSRWGNPDKIGGLGLEAVRDQNGKTWVKVGVRLKTIEQVVHSYECHARTKLSFDPTWLDPLRDSTALACACPLDQPCHVDVLLELLRRAT